MEKTFAADVFQILSMLTLVFTPELQQRGAREQAAHRWYHYEFSQGRKRRQQLAGGGAGREEEHDEEECRRRRGEGG